jgi:hypothetical protein
MNAIGTIQNRSLYSLIVVHMTQVVDSGKRSKKHYTCVYIREFIIAR